MANHMDELFMLWLNDEFKEMERQEYLDRYVQSGDYPQSFLDDLYLANEVNL
jgi:hypothetical protein